MLKRRWIWIPPVVVLAALVVGVGALYAYDATRSDVIAKGVTVAGVDVGGLGRDAARAKLRRVLVPRLVRPVTATYRGRSFVLTPRGAGLTVDVDGMADEAVGVSRRGNFLSRAYRDVRGEPIDEALSVHVAYAPAAVASFAKRIKEAVARAPQDAQVIPSSTSLQIVPSRNGIGVRLRRLRRVLAAQLVSPDAPHVLKVPAVVRKPNVTTAALPQKYPVYITICRSCFQLRLWLHLKLARVYTIAVGRQGLETPAGTYTINDKQVNPSWHVPNSSWAGALAGKVIPPGPDDPIKARWMGFYNGAGIHGTDAVWSLGTAASHGCIRMSIPDVIQLYDQVPYGTPIYVG